MLNTIKTFTANTLSVISAALAIPVVVVAIPVIFTLYVATLPSKLVSFIAKKTHPENKCAVDLSISLVSLRESMEDKIKDMEREERKKVTTPKKVSRTKKSKK